MMRMPSEAVRAYIYRVVLVLLGFAVFKGYVSQADADYYALILVTVLPVSLAAANTRVRG